MNFAIGAGAARTFFNSMVGKGQTLAAKNLDHTGMAMGGINAMAKFAAGSPSAAGATVGGVTGAAGGVISNDQDMTWYKGAAMGAFAGANVAGKGISSTGVWGAALGATYGMFSDDTSIMGGAFMGAGAGAAKRYWGAGKAAYKQAANATMIKTREAPGRIAKAGFGLNAVSQAAKRDIGHGWRGKGRKGNLKSNDPFQKRRARGNKERAAWRSGFRARNAAAYGGGARQRGQMNLNFG